MSVNICRNLTCFTFKAILDERLGIIIRVPIIKEKEQQMVVVFAYDTDFTTDREDC